VNGPALNITRDKSAKVWQRDELDFYVEPARATEQLLCVETFIGGILDPACGQGNVVKELLIHGYSAFGSDISRRVAEGTNWFFGEADFLADGFPYTAENIVTNPPFYRAKGTEAFIRRALTVAVGKVAIFTDICFLAGDGRATGLFATFPPSRIWIVTPRVSCPPGVYLAAGYKAGNGSSDWCWLVWDRTTSGQRATSLGWLTRDMKMKGPAV
jgi:hypothetical protein